MQNVKQFTQRYINWVIKLGRLKFSLLGFVILAIFALIIQGLSSLMIVGNIYWQDVIRSIIFGLLSAPFVIYFFTLLVEKLEHSRLKLAQSNNQLNENIIALNKAQQELEQKAEFLRSFIDASPDLVFYRSAQGQFLGCNKAMEILTGKTEKELLQMTPTQTFSPEIAERIQQIDQEILQNQQDITYEQWLKYPDGKLACFEIHKVPYFDTMTKNHCIMGFGRDITERKRYLEVIEKNSRDKTNLMATISHELRTPLNGIVGLSQILLDSQLTEQQRNYLKTIHVSAVSLGYIFSDIIDLEKLDSRRIEIYRKETDFHHFLNDINNIASFMAERKKLKFELQCDKHLPHWVMLDATRLSQILWNLISNAVKFTAQGKICLTVKSLGHTQLQFSLTDTGIGIAPQELDKIFTMYYQVEDKQHHQKALGSGIGLSISKHIAKLMDGDLTVQSEVGKGSTFTLTIKAQEVSQPSSLEQPQVNLPLNILLVEDIDVNITVAKAMLEKLGYQVDVAMTGQQAIAKFTQHQYDLLLLDIQLPDMTGFEVAQHLRQKYQADEYEYLPPLIALTANVINNKQEYLDKGMDDVLCKPLSIEALNRCLYDYFATDDNPAPPHQMKSTDQAAILDKVLLDELLTMLGQDFVQQNSQLFEQMMQEYLNELTILYQQYQQDPSRRKPLTELAHKIKGASASIGLKRLQQLAQQAQQDQDPQWHQHIGDWIKQLNQYWRQDLYVLQRYLRKA
ncbi:aerobic respiration two-component sensor histidine kinase ArcB [Volucribacter amazonae]|uniref:Aerobic respiration control sensor protein n=1 Tax=Volucribacter amazonae TaxID=256731 RepID=A0A9X4PDM2_9PAST|nr:aerobic respiration two-component sensor histidine kinase ArcB [Volucribacter amazonae]MDG6895621.1 hybrid sensor histidine kinase/response regulator [Volucribacter amazonae]